MKKDVVQFGHTVFPDPIELFDLMPEFVTRQISRVVRWLPLVTNILGLQSHSTQDARLPRNANTRRWFELSGSRTSLT